MKVPPPLEEGQLKFYKHSITLFILSEFTGLNPLYQTHQIVHIKYVQFLYINHTSIKLFLINPNVRNKLLPLYIIGTFWWMEELMIMGKAPCLICPQIQNLRPDIAHHTCSSDGDCEKMNF